MPAAAAAAAALPGHVPGGPGGPPAELGLPPMQGSVAPPGMVQPA
jgi:hypothetical protein